MPPAMLRGNWRGNTLAVARTPGSTGELRAGNITEADWNEIEDGIARSPGTA